MAATFAEYNFRMGMLSVSDRGMITVSFPLFVKDKKLSLVIQRCYINGKNGKTSTFVPKKNNNVELNARGMQRFSFSFSPAEISRYSDGALLEIDILDETDEIVVTVQYVYGRSTGWSLKSVTDVPSIIEDEEEFLFEEDTDSDEEDIFDEYFDEGEIDLRSIEIADMELSVRAYNCLKRAGIQTLGNLMDKTIDDMRNVRNLGRRAIEEVLVKMKEYGVCLADDNAEDVDEDAIGTSEIDFGNEDIKDEDDIEENVDWDNMSSVDRIKRKTKLDELGSKEIEGFCCHYCTKTGGEDGYILVEQIDVDLAEFIENEFVWGEFQKVVYQEFELKKQLTGTIYVIFLIHKGNTAVPIQKIEGYRKFGRKYVFTEPEVINFISGLNYSFKLDKNLNPVEAWVQQLKPIKLTGIITAPYLSKHVDSYLAGEAFEDDFLLDHSKGGSSSAAAVSKVERISSVEMGDFRQFCFGSMRQIEFGDINLFYGANGSGKTSILEALEYGFTAEIHRMKDFKVKYGNDRYPKITVKDSNGLRASFYPATSKKNSKEIERIWYGVPSGRTKTTLNEQFNRFNYFDSEAAYKFIHAKDQNDEAFEILFSNLLFGEEIVGYEKKWKRFQQAFDEAYSRIREELNSAEFWVSVYKDALTRTGDSIDVTPIYVEGARIHLINSHREYTATFDRLKAIKQDLEAIAMTVNNFKKTINFEPGMSFAIIKRVLQERRTASEQLQVTMKKLKSEIVDAVTRKNQLLDNLQKMQRELKQYESQVSFYEEAYNKYLTFHLIFDHPEKAYQLRRCEDELDIITAEYDMACAVSNSSSIQFLLGEAAVDVLAQTERLQYENELSTRKKQLLTLKGEYRKIQEQNNQKKNDVMGLQKIGISFLQKYGTAICPLCGEEYHNMEELKQHIEEAGTEEVDNAQLLKDISTEEQEIEYLQQILQRDDKLIRAYQDLSDIVSSTKAETNVDKVKYAQLLMQRKDGLQQRKIELEDSICQLNQQGITHAMITKATNFSQQNPIYVRFSSASSMGSFKEFYDKELSAISLQIEQFKQTIETTEMQIQTVTAEIDSRERALSAAETSDIQSRYIQVRNLYQMLMPIKDKFNMPDSADLYQWVIDYENFGQMVSQNISQVETYSNVEYEKQQAREYQGRAAFYRKKLDRCQAAVSALNRMPSLKTFVTDTVEANIQRISYYFRWMHHSGEFESLGIDEVGVYAIRGVDNRLVRVYEMSTGQRTSLAFSVMLAFYSVADTAPKCLLLDEPLATMDNVQVGNALDILKSLADQGTQIFFTSASLDTIKLFQNFFRNTTFDYREFEFIKRINGTVKINNNQFSAVGQDDAEQLDVEGLYIKYEHSLADVIKMYPNTLSNKQQLQGILKDMFPGENVRINLLLQAYEQGIYQDITNTPVINSPFAYRHKKRLIENYGVSNEFADWAITVWCIAYGSIVLKKTCEVKNPVTHI